MYSFKELRKACKLKIDEPEMRVAILGNCATQLLAIAIMGYAKQSGININIYDADYNQVDEQLLDQTAELYAFKPDDIILWLATDKLYEEFLDTPIDQRSVFAEYYMAKIERYWSLIEQHSNARIIQLNFTEIDDKALGHYSCKVSSTFVFQIRKLNYLLQEAMLKCSNIYPVDLLAIQIQIGQGRYYDAPVYYSAKMPVAMNTLPYVAKAVVDVLKAMQGKLKKCMILDLDNTLWGGIIGDDGLHSIEIGELGKGHVFTNFQRWLKQLKDYGIILAICSKNNENTAKEPFESHDEMVLRLEDISLFVANWNDKATNVRMIQESLNIGMDSIVFVDDNPFERNLIRKMIPDIEVPELPEDPSLYLECLQSHNYFDTVSYAGENANRTKQYQAEFERRKMELTFESIDEYLKSLEMQGECRSFELSKFSRIAQLTQRSNQFNLRTIRYTEDEIKRIAEDDSYITMYFTLRDKFGDHGVVSVVILEKKSNEELFIDTWLMSCRVLKRGMEEFVMNSIVQKAEEREFSKVTAEYIATNKNSMVKDIYRIMGFDEYENNNYIINVSEYRKKNTYIVEDV